MDFANIQFSIQGGIARLVLNRPDKMNSFTSAMHVELRCALDQLQEDRSVRVLLITGAGRGFCAGQDLADPAVRFVPGEPAPDLGEVVKSDYKPLVLRLQNLHIPTVAAINGIAAGAGVSLALACDLVIATQSAFFIQAFSKVGLIPDTGGTWFLPQRVGMARAMGLALLADKISAEQAAEWGLIWQCVEDDKFAETVQALLMRLAAAPCKALVRIRQAMHSSINHSLEQQLNMEADFMRELGSSPDYIEGVSAFLEKRVPEFNGTS